MFRKTELVSHLFFGNGVVKRVCGEYYVVEFHDGPRNILKKHPALQPRDCEWDEKELKEATEYLIEQRKKGEKLKWSQKFL